MTDQPRPTADLAALTPEEEAALRRDMNLDSPWARPIKDGWAWYVARLLLNLDVARAAAHPADQPERDHERREADNRCALCYEAWPCSGYTAAHLAVKEDAARPTDGEHHYTADNPCPFEQRFEEHMRVVHGGRPADGEAGLRAALDSWGAAWDELLAANAAMPADEWRSDRASKASDDLWEQNKALRAALAAKPSPEP